MLRVLGLGRGGGSRRSPDANGPFAGRGLQQVRWRDDATGEDFNAHYAKYVKDIDVHGRGRLY